MFPPFKAYLQLGGYQIQWKLFFFKHQYKFFFSCSGWLIFQVICRSVYLVQFFVYNLVTGYIMALCFIDFFSMLATINLQQKKMVFSSYMTLVLWSSQVNAESYRRLCMVFGVVAYVSYPFVNSDKVSFGNRSFHNSIKKGKSLCLFTIRND